MDTLRQNLFQLSHPTRLNDYDAYFESLVYETNCRFEDPLLGAKGFHDRDAATALNSLKESEDRLLVVKKELAEAMTHIDILEQRVAEFELQVAAR
ncbi:hypothetical protein Tco_1206834, partial [Tanacetum coccineum]